MVILNFVTQEPAPKGGKKSLKVVIAIGAIAGVLAIRSTLAADITLNLGAPVEFGQGVAQTTACDDDITVTPFSTFVNATGAGSHKFTSLKISGIDSTSDNCSGKTFLIKAYGDSGRLDLFNYSDSSTSEDDDYSSIEITDNAGVFTWTSGGTDGDDVENDENVGADDRDLADTSFTLNLTSNANPITRTPLALSEDVKRITVETYDTNLLSGRVLSSSQVATVVLTNLEDGLDGSDDPLPEGNFDGVCELFEPCIPYFTLADWISNMTDDDVEAFGLEFENPEFTRSQINNALSFKFVFDPEESSLNAPWILQFIWLGTQIGVIEGYIQEGAEQPGSVFGFDGNIGIFVPEGADLNTIALLFSLNGALQSNPSVGTWIPYGDQLSRTMPIRDFSQIFDISVINEYSPYFE
jgi:hypothetical protein